MKEDTLSSTPMAQRSSLYGIAGHLGVEKADYLVIYMKGCCREKMGAVVLRVKVKSQRRLGEGEKSAGLAWVTWYFTAATSVKLKSGPSVRPTWCTHGRISLTHSSVSSIFKRGYNLHLHLLRVYRRTNSFKSNNDDVLQLLVSPCILRVPGTGRSPPFVIFVIVVIPSFPPSVQNLRVRHSFPKIYTPQKIGRSRPLIPSQTHSHTKASASKTSNDSQSLRLILILMVSMPRRTEKIASA